MGTSNESKRNKDEEEVELIIPWAIVPYSVRTELVKRLNPDVALSGNDWRRLANNLGYTTGEISFFESEKDNNTSVLFRTYDTKPGASLNEVYRSLESMQREDCLQVIRKAMPEIHQAYNKANESRERHATRTSEMLASGMQFQWPGLPCSCPHSLQSPSSYGTHPYYPCSHSFTNCGAACHSQHLATCPAPPYHYHVPHPLHPVCQTFSHSDTFQKTFEPSISPPHYTPSIHGCAVQQPHPGCHGIGTGHAGSCSPRCNIRHNVPENQVSSQCGPSGFSPGHSDYHGSPTYNPKHNADMPLPNNISALDNSNLISSDSSSSSSTDSFNNSRLKFARQHSNECNVTQALNGDKRLRNNNSREALDIGDYYNQSCLARQPETTTHAANIGCLPRNGRSPKFAHHAGYGDSGDKRYCQDSDVKVRNGSSEFVHKYSTDACDEAKTSLALLEKLATVPDKFKPTNEYKTVVAEQKIEMNKRSKDGKTSVDTFQSNKGSSSDRSHRSGYENSTRIKVDSHHNMRDLKNQTTLKKSASMPVDIKKVPRDIDVFVTYSYDSESHGKQVLSLCKFLQSNGFTCSVDVSEKKSSARSLEQLEWCRKKVLEADFILVCISQKYLQDISSTSSSFFSQTNERQLHTREIYELMNYEYLNSQHSFVGEGNSYPTGTQRFVPLLFPKMTYNHVPQWMRNVPAYIWPEQYKDLGWMLTKPHERRKTMGEQLHERERNGSDLDAASGMDMTNLMNTVLCSS